MRKPISSDVKDLRLSPPSEKMCSPTFYLCLLSYLRTNLKLKKCQNVSEIRADLTGLFWNGASMVSAQERLDSALVRVFWRCGYFPRNPCGRLSSGYGRKKNISNALAIQWDHEGKIKYDAIAGQGPSQDKGIDSKHTNLVPKQVRNADDPDLQRPNEETIKEITKRHEWPCRRKVALAMPDHAAHKLDPAQ